MSLVSRAVALQGIGFAVALVATQGFAPVQRVEVDVAPTAHVGQVAANSGGTGKDHSGSGYVWRDNAWVKAIKFAKLGVNGQYALKQQSVVTVKPVPLKLRRKAGDLQLTCSTRRVLFAVETGVATPPVELVANNLIDCICTSHITKGYNGACETLAMDEIMVLLEAAS